MAYTINTAKPSKTEPVLYHWYKDSDGDLFVYVGDNDPDNGYPWLEILRGAGGSVVRSASYVVEPLTELLPGQIDAAHNDKVGQYS